MTKPFQNRRRPKWRQALRRLLKKVWIGWDLANLLAIYLAIFGPAWILFSKSGAYPMFIRSPEDIAWAPPDYADLWIVFGLDGGGISMLLRVVLAASVSLWAAFLATGAGAIAGWGMAAAGALTLRDRGYAILIRLTDLISCVPAMVLALIAFVGVGTGFWPSVTIFAVLIALFVAGKTARQLFDLEIEGDVLAARGLGYSRFRLFREIMMARLLPGILARAAGLLPAVLLAQAALSFAGFGLGRTAPGLGRLIAEGRAVMFEAPWLLFWPGLVLWVLAAILAVLGWAVRRTAKARLAEPVF